MCVSAKDQQQKRLSRVVKGMCRDCHKTFLEMWKKEEMGWREEVVAKGGFQVSGGVMTKAIRHSFKQLTRQPAGNRESAFGALRLGRFRLTLSFLLITFASGPPRSPCPTVFSRQVLRSTFALPPIDPHSSVLKQHTRLRKHHDRRGNERFICH